MLYQDGKLTRIQMEQLIQRHLKKSKIFAYGSYDEFFKDYFKRNLVCADETNKVRNVQAARIRYA